MRRPFALAALAGLATLVVVSLWRSAPTAAQPAAADPAEKAKAPLPLAQVILFSSGVGYFQRQGEVDGDARVDLAFTANDVNDLLKSLVLQDLGGGKVGAVHYDSPDPVESALRSFALDLTNNPTFGQILNQARGEKVEVALQAANAPRETVTGTVIGMEAERLVSTRDAYTGNAEHLNLRTAQGMRGIPLYQIQTVRFLSPVVEREFQRALDTLAAARDGLKKTVSLHFSGHGKRTVRVGYVTENPIWKTSYRLVVDANKAARLHGWAAVENTTDDDWTGVRMALVSGRPISFQMDLYQPLHVPRPVVEPELYASLRPPLYGGALTTGGQFGNLGAQGGGQNLGAAGGLGGNLGMQGGVNPAWNRYQVPRGLGGQFGLQGGVNFGFAGGLGIQGGQGAGSGEPGPGRRLTYEELQQRRQQLLTARNEAKEVGKAVAGVLDPATGFAPGASAGEVGDRFQYVVDQKVTLPRQKSALLPILDQAVEVKKVSIYNEGVEARHPLHGLRLKNAARVPLVQGPVTVLDEGGYAGDARLPDLQPGEERLVSYALDLGVEVKAESRGSPRDLVAAKIVRGSLALTHRQRATRTYLIRNRSEHDRALLVEHAVRPDWRLTAPDKPAERSRDFYRFELAVPAGKPARLDVVEESLHRESVALALQNDPLTRALQESPAASQKVKAALATVAELRTRLNTTQQDLAQEEKQLEAIATDQARLRENLGKVPQTSAAYKRYLDKFDAQEPEIEKLQTRIKELKAAERRQTKEFVEFLEKLTVE